MGTTKRATATNAAPAMAKAATTAIAATTGSLPAVKTVTVQMVTLTGKVVSFKGNTARSNYYNWCIANIGPQGMQLAQLLLGLQRYEEAIPQLETLVAQDGADPELAEQLQQAREAAGQQP